MKKTLSQIIKQSFYEINENYMQFLTAFAVQTFLLFAAFLLFPPFNIILLFLVSAITLIGVAKFSLQVLNKKAAKVETVASFNKNSLSHIITFIVKTFQILFFSVFFIIPGIKKWLEYSQTAFILAQNEKLSTFETLTESRKLTKGVLGKILLLKVVHWFIGIILISFSASVIVITKVFFPISQELTLIWLVLMSLVLLAAIVLPFATVSNTILYENLKLTNKFNQVPQKTFLQEVAEDFITAFSIKKPQKPKTDSKETPPNKKTASTTTKTKTTPTKKIATKTTSKQTVKPKPKTSTKQNKETDRTK
jgi:hypothetical protein